jgi:hypothetical protein
MTWPRDDYLIQLPTDWTPEQALAVYDWLSEISAVVWRHYERPIRGLLACEPKRRNPAQQDLFGFDDPAPF